MAERVDANFAVKEVAVASSSQSTRLWAVENDGDLVTTYSPDTAGSWRAWQAFSNAGALPGSATGITAGELEDGRLQLWLIASNGDIYTTWQEVAGENGAWAGWEDFSLKVGSIPGGAKSIQVGLLTDLRLQLWVASNAGAIWTTWKTSTDPNASWSGWENFGIEVGQVAGSAQALAVGLILDGPTQLWAVLNDGAMWTTWKTSTDPNAGWSGWEDFSAEAGSIPEGATRATVARLTDGRLQLFACNGQGQAFTSWKTSTDPNAGWTGWEDFSQEIGGVPNGAAELTALPLSTLHFGGGNGGAVVPQLWVSDQVGVLWQTRKANSKADAPWTAWTNFIDVPG